MLLFANVLIISPFEEPVAPVEEPVAPVEEPIAPIEEIVVGDEDPGVLPSVLLAFRKAFAELKEQFRVIRRAVEEACGIPEVFVPKPRTARQIERRAEIEAGRDRDPRRVGTKHHVMFDASATTYREVPFFFTPPKRTARQIERLSVIETMRDWDPRRIHTGTHVSFELSTTTCSSPPLWSFRTPAQRQRMKEIKALIAADPKRAKLRTTIAFGGVSFDNGPDFRPSTKRQLRRMRQIESLIFLDKGPERRQGDSKRHVAFDRYLHTIVSKPAPVPAPVPELFNGSRIRYLSLRATKVLAAHAIANTRR